MQTLTSTPAPLAQSASPTGARTHRPGWPVIVVLVIAAATIIAVVTVSVWWATSDPDTTPTRTVQSTTAAELTTAPAMALVRSANAAEVGGPVASPPVQSANAAEQRVPAWTAVGHTAHVPPAALVVDVPRPSEPSVPAPRRPTRY